MTITTANEQNIIERDVHCPFCKTDKAFLFSAPATKSTKLLLPPAFGLKYILSCIFTLFFHVFTHGLPWFEFKKSFEFHTYAFCPECGKNYNATVSASSKATKEPRLYKSLQQKKFKGICGGIAEYTEVSLKVVRLVMSLYVFGGVISVVIGLFNVLRISIQSEKLIMPGVNVFFGLIPLVIYLISAFILDYNPKHTQ